MHALAIVASVFLICACVLASVLLVVYHATSKAPASGPVTPVTPATPVTPVTPVTPAPPTDAKATPRAPTEVVISTTDIQIGQPGYFYHETPEVVISRSVMVNGVEVELPPEEDPPNYGGHDFP